ncbi:adhesion G protein-coupled receptor F5-like [Salminus brasiliensis]|uniref:adhesion G protein-coupled receptor F5-like n=1 Tax=Salminus brasiliensis TaxID=930266 RepID=UPI003B836648
MAIQGSKFKCLLVFATVFFILLKLMEERHEVLKDSEITVEEYSYRKELNQIRQEVSAVPVQYVAVAEFTVPLSILKDDVEQYFNNLTIPIWLQNSTEITDINITAECQQTLIGVQCVCQNHYVWANNNCFTYPACDNVSAGACGCINAKPSGQMCIPKSELPVFDLTIRIDMNDNAKLINFTQSDLQSAVYFAYQSDTILQVSKVDLTTECHLNSSGYQCKCGDQYFWPCDKCVSYGYCDSIINATCGCINGFPKDGQFCQPKTELTEISRTISMRIDEEFDSTLTNTLSEKYKSHSSIIISSVDSVYQSTLSSYKAGSVTITRFRPGSVISDFRIVTTSNTLDFSKANAQLASALTAKGLLVSANSFAQTEEDMLYDLKNGKIYPGKNMVLTCNTPDPNIPKITWSMNDINIEHSTKYQFSTDNKTLTVTSTNDGDNGKYACTMTFNSMPYISFQKMSIQPSPEVNVNTSKTLLCDGSPIRLQCCAESSYTIQWSLNTATGQQSLTDPKTICNTYTQNINKTECEKNDKIQTFTCGIRDNAGSLHSSVPVTITVTSKKSFNCFNAQFGAGNYNDIKPGACDANSVGNVTARCMLNPTTSKYDWEIVENSCVLRVLQDLLNRAKFLRAEDVPSFLGEILNATEANADEITRSTVNIVAVVGLLNSTSNVSQSFRVDQSIMRNFLKTVDVIGSINARNTWLQLNKHNTTEQTSSLLLKSTEDMGKTLTNESFSITTKTTQLSRTSTNGPFFGTFGINSTTQIAIPMFNGTTLITTIVFSLFNTVLPVRNTTYNHSQTDTSINADVAAVIVEKPVHNISLTFDVQNNLLGSPQCVFWNFSLLNGIGGWDSTGCEVMPVVNHTDKITCKCNHTTSFSILMSPFKSNNLVLAFITYIGVGISLICLIVCFIIEGIIWKPMTRNDTSYMRHVSIVNIALSLLIADICFIIGAAIVKEGEPTPEGSCSTATFFMHFFYLALFFWMLFSAFLLLYRTVVVFAGMSRTKMMVIAFTVGYGAPLLIAVITVAVTAGGKGYVQEDSACWLNWKKTKAILAFVIPALTIVAINFLVLLVVLCKMLKRGVGATTQPDEKHTIVVIARCVAILTPLFGLTWGFGIGTMVSSALGLHIVFAILNSLQGFFILVFAVLLDSKIREELAGKLSLRNISSNRTRSTSTGPSSSSGQGFFDRFWRRNVYHVADSSGIAAASSSHSDTFVNT